MMVTYHGTRYQWSFRRFFPNFLAITLILTFLILYVSYSTKATLDKKVFMLTVRKNDTLWSIAKSLDSARDPRQVIQAIKTRNHLKDLTLIPGQKLEIEIDHP
ncbi:MAG TPA: LysM peptidoglycan-binding domain-containing protein [Bacillota bacterium]|nr:LysM peptidoglycan-binding domain-containing protein [Bacillota bacterium]